MIRHAWSVLCEKVVTDKDSNNVTLSVIEQLVLKHDYGGDDPTAIIRLPFTGILVSLWHKGEKDTATTVKFRIRIKGFATKFIGGADGEIVFGDKERARTFVSFSEIPAPVEGAGTFFFVVEYDVNSKWKKAAEIPFMLKIGRIAADPSN